MCTHHFQESDFAEQVNLLHGSLFRMPVASSNFSSARGQEEAHSCTFIVSTRKYTVGRSVPFSAPRRVKQCFCSQSCLLQSAPLGALKTPIPLERSHQEMKGVHLMHALRVTEIEVLGQSDAAVQLGFRKGR